MIFVTVGTHEQQFNRLIKKIDELVENNVINDEVFLQIGYSTYLPKHCEYTDFMSYDDMQKMICKSDVIITHGGPASFIDVLSKKKRLVIVPRQKKYDEHINDHQLIFCNEIIRRGISAIVVTNIDDLFEAIKSCFSSETKFISNNSRFVDDMEKLIKGLFNEKN